VPSPLGGIESAASVAPWMTPLERGNEMNIEQVESMKAHIVTDSGAVIYIERTDAVSDAEWASALAMIDRADSVIDAAREVIENWPTNRLAASVNLLDGEVQEVDAAVEEFMPAAAVATEPAKVDHDYTSDLAMEMVLEIVRGWDDDDLASFLSECHPGEVVAVGESMRRYDETSRRSVCVE
jgi:hypothetical protein